MATLSFSPAIRGIDIEVIENDYVYDPITVLDDVTSLPINFSGYTAAKLTIKQNELASELISFTSTGSTYQIDISQKSTGQFIMKCNSLAIPSGVYNYSFAVSNSSQRLTVMMGRFIVTSTISI